MTPFTSDERLSLIERLLEKDLLLRSLWDLTEVYFTDEVPTAAVRIVNETIQMVFNREFWESMPPDAQLFIVCHEQLHLMLDHFERLQFHLGDGQLKNIAADLAINHMLVRMYYFEKTHIPNWQKYCWVDTVFPKQKVSDNETAEYYYALLKQKQERNEEIAGDTLDDHEYGKDDNATKLPSKIKEAVKKAAEQVEDHIADQCECTGESCEEMNAGSGSGGGSQTHHYNKSPKRSWKQVYKKIPKRLMTAKNKPHWVMSDRRQHMIKSSASLPGQMEVSKHDKVIVHIYLDTSGSCEEDARYFLRSALTLPPKMFTVRMFGFDCKIYDIPLTPPYKLSGFGGTSFQTIADHMENHPKVDAAIVFTDGYAPKATIKQPRKWHWFVTPNGSAEFIDDRSSVYMLQNFDWRA